MLSAVAARRAALAASSSANANGVTQTVPDASSSSTPGKPKRTASSSAQKRKSSPSAPSGNARAVKKPNSQRKSTSDPPKASTSSVVVNDDDDRHMLIDDATPTTVSNPDILTPGVTPKRARAWSPSRPVEDSSEEEDIPPTQFDLSHIEDAPSHPATRPIANATDHSVVLSTFSPIEDENFFPFNTDETKQALGLSCLSTALIFRPQDALCLLGTYTVYVLAGSISLQGTHLLPSLVGHNVYAPSSSPLPILRHHPISSSGSSLENIPQGILDKVGPQDCLLVLRELRTGVEALGNIQPKFAGVFRPETRNEVISMSGHNLGLRGVHIVRYSSPSYQPFVIPETWESALDIACKEDTDGSGSCHKFDAPRFLVRGPKKTGKSTFARTLVNRLLTRYARIAYLECDLGQSEFTPAGMVALNIVTQPVFGPTFTHPTIPHLAHFIGSTTPRDSPALYISAIENCLQTYRLDVERAADIPDDDVDPEDTRITDIIPLIVNTMGWTKGLGADLNAQIETLVDPSEIFEFTSLYEYDRPGSTTISHRSPPSFPGSVSDPAVSIPTAPAIHLLTPISSPLSSQYTAAEHRSFNLISYLHAIFPTSSSPISRNITAQEWSPTPLLSRAPYEIIWPLAFPGGLVIATAGGDDVVPSEAAYVLPGALVALVAPRAHAATNVYANTNPTYPPEALQVGERDSGTHDALGYQQGRAPPSPEISHCIGLALIRGISLPSPTSSAPASISTPSSRAGPAAPPHPAPQLVQGTGALAQVLTPVPGVLLGSAKWAVKGSLELPIWEMFPAYESTSREDETIAGVPLPKVPYLRWTAAGREKSGEMVFGGERRRVRRNLMRKAQM